MFEGNPLLLLHHTGARSGKTYVNPLAYQADDGRYVVFASKGGAPTNPGWYHNLMAHPDTTVEVGSEEIPVHADGGERRGARPPVSRAGRTDPRVRRIRAEDGRAHDPGDRAHSPRLLARAFRRRQPAAGEAAEHRGAAGEQQERDDDLDGGARR